MSSSRQLRLAGVLAVSCALIATGCGSSASSTSSSPGAPTSEAQQAAAGDIPDNQQFLAYKNTRAGYSVKYPEGWARKGPSEDLTFADKDNQVHVAISQGPAPTAASAKAALEHSAPGSAQLKVKAVATETFSGQPAIHLTYNELGPADPVTGKRLPLMVDRYVLAKGGKVATIDESTPVGVDNVDAYRLIIESFKWL
jgi:hypothetical protein